jgi:transketolase
VQETILRRMHDYVHYIVPAVLPHPHQLPARAGGGHLQPLLTGAIRALAMDAVQKANSGHPGAPMGMAEIAEVLWRHHLRHNPANPQVGRPRPLRAVQRPRLDADLRPAAPDRLRRLSIDDLKNFRQLHSQDAGHPEYGYTPGVETTTGPLGQGITNAVGMALAEKLLAAEFNRPGHEIVDHHTYVFLGDGCLMEGISHEACSLAGTWGLGKLIAFYDDNGISIDGHVEGWFTDDTPKRFEAYGWQVIRDVDGHDPEAIDAAIAAKADTAKPSLICCKTIIGAGSPNKQGSHDVHGAPLGAAEIAAARAHIGWNHPALRNPGRRLRRLGRARPRRRLEAHWKRTLRRLRAAFPELAAEFERRMAGELPADWAATSKQRSPRSAAKAETIATRKASQNAIEALRAGAARAARRLGRPGRLQPDAVVGRKGVTADQPAATTVYYGVREFGMAAIANGMALHGGLIPYTATFLMFSEYARNALRMAALMKQRQIFVFTHDSIGLGEDGPTHQPVEQIATLRLIPNMDVWRPCDTTESAVAWARRSSADGPTSRCASRARTCPSRRALRASGRRHPQRAVTCCRKPPAQPVSPQAVIIATGSEVALAPWRRRRQLADRRRRGARGVHALDQRLRPPGRRRTRQRAARRPAARRGRSRRHRRLVQVRRARRPRHRHRPLRRVGAGRRAVQVFRHHGADAVVQAVKSVHLTLSRR